MTDTHIDWRKNPNIRPVEFPHKEQYYSDILNIQYSWSGRVDINICNTFVMEAVQQLTNAIELFEDGYFDCAYYSLRSAVDVSTTMVFLEDMPDEEKEKFLEAWKDTKDFPMQGQMIKQLSLKGTVFADMKEKMSGFFIRAKELSASLNKYVHKQGLQHFYISRNHPLNWHKSQDSFITTFEHYLQRCIGVVAVMRLVIDPFPILLMDDEILYRCFNSLTVPYSEKFVEKYIGTTIVEQYKQTDLYSSTYNSFIGKEKKNEAVFNVTYHNYIDTRKIDNIFKQLHLLTMDDIVSVLLVVACEKVVRVYCNYSIVMYFTDRSTNRKAMSWAFADFKHFSEVDDLINQPYDEAYISVLFFNNTPYFVEHNELLGSDDVGCMVELLSDVLLKVESTSDK